MPTLSNVRFRVAAFLRATAATLLIAAFIRPALAANQTWTGTSDGTWNTSANWGGNTPPGSTSITTSADVATFNSTTAHETITIDANRDIGSILFDTSAAGAYTVGSSGPNAGNTLLLSSGGSILDNSTVTNAETFNATLTIEGNYSFIDNSASTLTFAGNISEATTSTLTIGGQGDTTVSSVIGIGAGSLTIAASGPGSLIMRGAGIGTTNPPNPYLDLNFTQGNVTLNNKETYTGATTLSSGTLKLDFNTAFNPGSTGILYNGVTAGTLNLNGGNLQLNTGAAASTQTFGSTNINAGALAAVTTGGAGSGTFQFGAITRNAGGQLLLSGSLGTYNFTSITGYSTAGSVIPGIYMVDQTSNDAFFAKAAATTNSSIAEFTSTSSTNLTGATPTLNSATTDYLYNGSNSTVTIAGGTGHSLKLMSSGTSLKYVLSGTLNVPSVMIDTLPGNSAVFGNGAGQAGANNGELVVYAYGAATTPGGSGGVIFNPLNVSAGAGGSLTIYSNLNGPFRAFILGNTTGGWTYTGATTVNAGTVQLANANFLSSPGPLVVNNLGTVDMNGLAQSFSGLSGNGRLANQTGSATLSVNGSTTQTFTGSISGAISLAVTGGGTQTLSGISSYTGATTINSGTLVVGASSSTAGTVTLNTNASYNSATPAISFANTAGVAVGDQVTGGAGTYIQPGTFVTAVTATQVTLSQPTYNEIPFLGGSPPATPSGTPLTFGQFGPLGNTSGVVLSAGTGSSSASLLIGGPFTVGNPISTANVATSGAYTIGGNTANASTFSGTITLNSTTNSTTLSQVTGGTTTFGGIIGGAGGITVVSPASGSGTVILTNANTFSGNTAVTSGTINLSNQLALQDSTLTTAGVVFDQSVSGKAFTLGGLSGSSNLVLQNNASTPAAINLSIGNNNTPTSYSGVLSDPAGGSGSLTKVGTGTSTLTNANSLFTGSVTINAGTLQATTSGALGAQGAGGRAITVVGGTFDLAGINEGNNVVITLNGQGVGNNGALINSSASTDTQLQTGVQLTLNTDSAIGIPNSGRAITLTNSMNSVNWNSHALTVIGPGMLQVDLVPPTPLSSLTINGGGTFQEQANNATGGSTTTAVTINSGGTLDFTNGAKDQAGTLTINNGSVTTRGSTFTLNSTSATITATGTTGSITASGNSNNLTFAGSSSTISVTNASDIFTISAPVFQTSGAMTKTGNGTLILSSGNNTFAGGVNVNAGTLQVTNTGTSATGNQTVTVANGATLAGSTVASQGFITGPTNVKGGGDLAAYSGAALTFSGGLTLDSDNSATSPIANFTLSGTPNGTSNPLVNITNSNGFVVNSAGKTTVNITAGSTPQIGTYDLFGYAGTAPTFANFNSTVTGGGFTYALQNNTAQHQIDLLVSAATLTWTGNANSSWDTGGTNLNWGNGATAVAYGNGATLTFQDANSVSGGNVANGTVQIQAAGVTPGSVAFTNNSVAYTLSDASGTVGIAGAIGITKSGTGNVTFASANSFTGTTTISAGTLTAGNASALGNSASAPLQLNGGTLDLAIDSSINAYNATVGGSAAITSDKATSSSAGITHTLGTLSIGANTLTINAGANVNSGTAGVAFGVTTLTGSPTFTVNNGATAATALTLGALNFGGVTRPISKTGSGTLILAGAATSTNFSGTNQLLITGGTVQANANSVTDGGIGGNNDLTLVINPTSGTSTFNTQTFNQQFENITIGGSAGTTSNVTGTGGTITIRNSGSPTLTYTAASSPNPSLISANLSLGGTTAFNIGHVAGTTVTTGGDLTISGAISTSGFAQTNTGILVLSGNNSGDSGTFTADQGVLSLQNAGGNSLSTGALSLTPGSGQSVVLDLGAGNASLSRVRGVNAGQIQVGASNLGTVGFQTSVAAGASVNITGPGGVAPDWASLGFTPLILQLGTTASLGPLNFVSGINLNSGARIIQVDRGNFNLTATNFYDAQIQQSGSTISNGGGPGGTFNKTGSGVLSISGTSSDNQLTYGVGSGVLLLSNGSTVTHAIGSDPVNMGWTSGTQAGSFGGNGSTAGAVTFVASTSAPFAHLIPGNLVVAGLNGSSASTTAQGTIGTLGTGALTLASGNVVDLILGTAGSGTPSVGSKGSQVQSTNLTLPTTAGSLTVNLNDNAGAAGNGSIGAGTYKLFSYTGSLTGGVNGNFNSTFAIGNKPASVATDSFTFVNTGASNGEIDLIVSQLALTWTGHTNGTGAVNDAWDTTQTNWANGAVAAAYTNGPSVIFNDANAVSAGLPPDGRVTVQGGGVAPGSVTFSNSSVAYAVGGGPIGGTGILSKSGSAVVALSAANTYSGGTALNAGTLRVAASTMTAGNAITSGPLGTGTLTITSGATLQDDGSARTLANNVVLTGAGPTGTFTFASSGSGSLTFDPSGVSPATTFAISDNLAVAGSSATLAVNNNTTINQAISYGSISNNVLFLYKTGPGTLTVGGASTIYADLELNGGATTIAGGSLNLPVATTSGFVPDIVMGFGAASVAGLNVTSGTVTIAGGLQVSHGADGNGNVMNAAVTQTGGVVNVGHWAVIGQGSRNGGSGTGGYGAYYLSGTGILNANTDSAADTNGTNIRDFQFGGQGSGDNTGGVFNLSGSAALNLDNNARITFGANGQNTGTATFNQTGGTVAFYSDSGSTPGGSGGVVLGDNDSGVLGTGNTNSTGVYTYNLNAGTLTAPQVTRLSSAATGTFNFAGGTLKPSPATASGTTFFQGLSAAYINGAFGSFAGGATIDSNGQNITIGQALLAPTGNGVNSSFTITGGGGSGYVVPPTVTIGGSGSGATAYATLDANGHVNGVVLTNPGIGYTGTPTVAFAGGGGTGAGATASTAVNTSGGLTKQGAGSLTLSGANTYTGPTAINAGTLALSAASTNNIAASGSIRIGSGATLDVSGLTSGTLALGTSAIQSLSGPSSGTGSVTGSVSVSSGSTVAGSSGAALAISGALTLQGGSLSNFTLGTPNGTGGTALVTTTSGGSSLVVSGAHTIHLSGAPVVGTYDLFSYSGSLSAGNFNNLTLGTQPGTLSYSLSNNTAGSQVDLIVAQAALTWTGHTGGNGAVNDNWTTNGGDTNWADATNAAVSFQDGKGASFTDANPFPGGSAPDGTVTIQAGGVAPAAVSFNNSSVNYTLSNASSDLAGIKGGAGITKLGTASLTLLSPNTFTGAVQITAGKINLQNGGALGTSSGVTVASGAALELQGGIAVGSIPLGLTGTGLAASPAGALNSVSGANSYAGAISLGSGGATIGSSNSGDTLTLTGGINNGGPPVGGLTINGAGNVAIGTAAIAGGGGLTYSGTGTLTLSAANSYGGPTTVSSGTLRVTNSSGSATGTSGAVGISGATLSGTGTISGPVTLSSSAVLVAPASGTLTLSGGLTLAATGSSSTFTLGTPNNTANPFIATSASSGNSLIANGTHTVNFTGSPQSGTYDLFAYARGVTNFNNFTLGSSNPTGFTYQLVNNSAQSQIDVTVTPASLTWTGQTGGNGATNPNWTTSGSDTNWANFANAAAAYVDGAGAIFGDTNPITANAPGTTSIVIQAGGVAPSSVTFGNTGAGAGGVDYTLSNTGSDSNGIKGATGITVTGTGSVTLLSPNSFTGAVLISAGKINVQNSAALGTSSGVTVASGAGLELQGGVSIGAIPLGLSGTGVVPNSGALNSVSGANSYAGNITIGSGGGMIASSNAGDTLTLSGTITNGGPPTGGLSVTGPGNVTISNAISGGGGLSKSGSGTLALTNSSGSTYGGATSIGGGLGLVSNTVGTSATGTNSVTIGTGGSLGGSGFIGGPVATASSGTGPGLNGHLAPGAGGSAATLSINNTLALDINSILDFRLNAPNVAAGSGGNDLVSVLGTSGSNGGLTLNNNLTLNVTPGLNFAAGTYHLITYTGSLFDNSGSFSGWTATSVGSHPYHFAVGSGELDLVVLAGNGSAQWNVNGNGDFSQTPNWSPQQLPSGAGLTATFGNGTTVTVNNNVQVLVDGAFTDGTLAFTNTNGAQYTLTSDGNNSHGITLTSGNSSGAAVNVTAGTHSIFANLTLADSGGTTFNIAGGAQLTMGDSSIIGESGGSQGLTKAGDGTLVMLGTNSYTGPTMLNGGTTVISSDKSLGAAGLITINAATLDSEAFSLVSSRNYAVGDAASTINVEAFRTLEITTPVTGTGSLTVTGGNSSSTLILDKANSYAGNTNVNSGYLRLDVTSGTPTIGASATVTIAAGATLELAGTVSALSSGTTRANVVNNSSANTGGMLLVTGSNQQVGTIDGTGDVQINDGADLTASRIRQNALTIGESSGPASLTIRQSGPGGGNPINDTAFSGNLNSLTIANNGAALGTRTYRGTLNINNNGLVIPYGTGPNPLNDINDMVRSGYNGGAFNGQGIISTTATQGQGLNVAVADNAQLPTPYTTFEGQTVSTNSVLVRMTYMDDLTLAGTVSQNDAIIFGANYDNSASSNHYWSQGDLNHDGKIDQNDAILFGAFYNTALPPLDGSGGGLLQFNAALGSSSFGGSLSAVPEPATIVLLALGGLAGLLVTGRRRRLAAVEKD